MAIILRKDKGIPLTHDQVDENFSSNFYSASLEAASISLYYTASALFGPAQKTVQIPLQWTTDGINLIRSGAPGTIVKISGSIQTGVNTIASGLYSYAGGIGTVASGAYQQVQGAYNISSSNPAAFIVGNGNSTTRSNLIYASGSQVVVSGSLDVSGSITGDGSKLGNVNALTKVFYVTENGNDNYDGKTLQTSFRTIKKACLAAAAQYAANPTSPTGFAPYRININVKSGYYEEIAPIIVPAFTTINGNDLRSVIVKPTPATNGLNLFQLNNATYIYGLRLEGCIIDNLEDPRQGFYFAYQPGAYLTTSPYIQNCTAVNTPFDKFYAPLDFENENPLVGNGPGGMIVDDSVLDPYSPLKSMIVDAYTQVAFNGIGICLRGRGYGQMVSFFTNFSRVGVLALDGGHASLLNSNTTFGDYGLRASGSRILVNPDMSEVDPAKYSSDATILSGSKLAIQDYEIAFLQASGSSVYRSNGTYSDPILVANCRKDAGFLVDALVADLQSKDASNTSKFIQGYFKGQDVSANKRYTLPSASNAYTKGAITVIPQKSGSDAGSDDKKFTKDYLLTFNAIADYIYTSSLSAPAKGKVRQLVNALNYTISSVVLQEKDTYKKVVPTIATAATAFTSGDILGIINNRNAILENEIYRLQNEATNFTNSRYDDAVVIAKCRRDAGHLLDAVEADLLTTGSAYTTRFIQAYFPPISGSTATRILNSGLGTAIPTLDGASESIAKDYNLAFGYINSYIASNNIAVAGTVKSRVATLIAAVQDTITDLVVTNNSTSTRIQEVTLLEEFGSLITSTSHDFSYAGSGVNYLAFPNNQGGTGKTSIERRIVGQAGGRVYHTSGDETGDFYAGDDFVIRQDTGTVDGRAFSKSVSALTIPINLALEG